MAAQTQDRNTPLRDAVDFEFPMAAGAKCYAGSIGVINASGYLTNGSTATGLKAVGVFQAQANNTGGSNGAILGKVRRGCFKFNNFAADLVALTDIGADCYIVDDNTVAKTSGSGTRSVAGKVRAVESDGVWVDF